MAPDDRATAWQRLRRMGAPRVTRANALAGALTLALGFAIATQIQANAQTGLQGLRQDELVRVLDDVTQRSSRLDQQIRELEGQRDRLRSGADSAAAAAAQAQSRLDELSILAGTVAAKGPGIRLTIYDGGSVVRAAHLLDILQELRDAGAEVIQMGHSRIVASSYFADSGSTVSVDGTSLSRPIVVLAIGDPATLSGALKIPGGIVDTVKRLGASSTIEERSVLTIDALHPTSTPRYAAPVPEATTAPSGS
jgi:uncharacterized protein YlxW (UPF0749 family)